MIGVCPHCSASLRLRRGPRGIFWGCTAYPSCRNAVALSEAETHRLRVILRDYLSISEADLPEIERKLRGLSSD
jgi:ssDNA-binding Zn-finger/Zn-ribbon topoisomerase 1